MLPKLRPKATREKFIWTVVVVWTVLMAYTVVDHTYKIPDSVQVTMTAVTAFMLTSERLKKNASKQDDDLPGTGGSSGDRGDDSRPND
jgi:hypothetical protein